MDKYVRLTASEEKDGAIYISCAGMGTEKCTGNCALCEMMRAILKQLWAFEEAYCATEK